MANAITRQVLYDGQRKHVLKFTIIGDASGEETATLVNVAGDMGLTNKLVRIQSALNGFGARLLWDATTPVMFHTLTQDSAVDLDYYEFGGIVNNGGAGVTGDIKITTLGLATTAGKSGSIVLTFLKY